MNGIKWTDIATAIVAIYAAVLSTYNLWLVQQDRTTRVKIALSIGFLTYPGNVVTATLISVSNHGKVPALIRSIWLEMPDNLPNRRLIVPHLEGEKNLPCELNTGQNTSFWIAVHTLAESLRENGLSGDIRVRAHCSDGTGRDYQSRTLRFDIDAWLKEN